jgi:uncharacterized membrane protein
MRSIILYVVALWLLGRAVDGMVKDAEHKAYEAGYHEARAAWPTTGT